ncbi:MAG: quinone oxidoreductase [Motiliproteus sp.]
MNNQPYAITASHPGDTSVLKQVDIDPSTPSATEVMIRQTAVGVNFIDTYFRSGLYPWPQESDLILGCEGAGVIEAIGADVSGFSVGDRVAYTVVNGSYTSHRTVEERHLVHIPDSVSDQEAAAVMLKGLTAYYLLHDSYPVKAGETVLFHAAAGGVGLLAGQWLKSKGVRTIGTAGGAQKCALAKANGFDEVIDYKSEDFVARVMELTQGEGVSVVYDSIGKDTIMGSIECLKRFGSLVSFGQSSGMADQFRISDLASGSLNVCRPILFHFTEQRSWLDNASRQLFDSIGEGILKVHIGATWPLNQVNDAHQTLESRGTKGSTILIP